MKLKQYREQMKTIYGEQYNRFLECKMLDFQIALEDFIKNVYMALKIDKLAQWLNNKL